MKVDPPPYPGYREQPTVVTREYRVVFWEHQLPPDGSDIAPDQMGWAELTVDLSEVEDAHEAISWAEDNIDKELDGAGIAWAEPFGGEVGGALHGERIYALYAKVPEEDRFLHIAGWVPVIAPDPRAESAGYTLNLNHRHPLPPP
jgi:hypothetical protein